MSRRLLPLAIGAAALVAFASPASSDELTSSWANVNACSPTELGARAQLAGDGSKTDMRVRFTAQWLSPNGWVPLNGASSSPWQSAGSAEYTWGQAGWTFSLSVPPGKSYELRAVAEMQMGGGKSATQVTGSCSVSG